MPFFPSGMDIANTYLRETASDSEDLNEHNIQTSSCSAVRHSRVEEELSARKTLVCAMANLSIKIFISLYKYQTPDLLIIPPETKLEVTRGSVGWSVIQSVQTSVAFSLSRA
jgi:hypothetical protein